MEEFDVDLPSPSHTPSEPEYFFPDDDTHNTPHPPTPNPNPASPFQTTLLPMNPIPPIIVSFPATGPMGITFENKSHENKTKRLTISQFAILPDDSLGPVVGKDVLKVGLVLDSVNGIPLHDKSFKEQIEILKSSDNKRNNERKLSFVAHTQLTALPVEEPVVLNNPLLLLMSANDAENDVENDVENAENDNEEINDEASANPQDIANINNNNNNDNDFIDVGGLDSVNGIPLHDKSFKEQIEILKSSDNKRNNERKLSFVAHTQLTALPVEEPVVLNNPLLLLMSANDAENDVENDVENAENDNEEINDEASANPQDIANINNNNNNDNDFIDVGGGEEKKDSSPHHDLPTELPLQLANKPNTANTLGTSRTARSTKSNDSGTSSILDQLTKRREDRESLEKRQKETEEKLRTAKVYHPYHIRLMASLNNNEGLGPAVYVRVTNESYWFQSRKSLGGANHGKRMVSQEKMGTKYQVSERVNVELLLPYFLLTPHHHHLPFPNQSPPPTPHSFRPPFTT